MAEIPVIAAMWTAAVGGDVSHRTLVPLGKRNILLPYVKFVYVVYYVLFGYEALEDPNS